MHYTSVPILMFTIGLSFIAGQAQTRQPDVAAGKSLFHEYCAVCHGADGKGNGPAVGSLWTAPSDLTTLQRRNGGKFPAGLVRFSVYSTVSEVHRDKRKAIPAHGSPDMPIWGDVFRGLQPKQKAPNTRVDDLVAYLESLQEP